MLQGRLEAVDVEKAVQYVMACMNFDGGFGRVPGSESHAGQVSQATPQPCESRAVNVCIGVLLCGSPGTG